MLKKIILLFILSLSSGLVADSQNDKNSENVCEMDDRAPFADFAEGSFNVLFAYFSFINFMNAYPDPDKHVTNYGGVIFPLVPVTGKKQLYLSAISGVFSSYLALESFKMFYKKLSKNKKLKEGENEYEKNNTK